MRPQNVTSRSETPEDRSAIQAVNDAAFGQPDEAQLVDELRREEVVLISLVAEFEKQIIGHILFSRMWMDTANGPILAAALAPMAVLPEYQRQGIGGHLIRRGLDVLREQGERIVIALGHRGYYPRFGFSKEKARLLDHPFPPEAFMAIELTLAP